MDRTTLRFLRAAISFIPVARGDDANMRNCSFIFRQPGREFVVISGDGDWEYEFCEDAVGEIKGRCVRKPIQRYVWDGAKAFVDRSLASGALPATGLYTGGLSGLRAWTH